MKFCPKCKQNKDRSEFSIDRSKKDGLFSYCKDCKNKQMKIYYQENKENKKKYQLEYNKENKEHRYEQKQEYYIKNKDIINEKRRIKYAISSRLRLDYSLYHAIYKAIKENKETINWSFDFSKDQLRRSLENQFTSEMNWDNYGSYWEIDHIIPVNTFNYFSVSDKQCKICWSLFNLRPLTLKENRSRPKDGSDVIKGI